jgi:hypothetical protein
MSQIVVRCAQCNSPVKVPEGLFGQSVQCPSCQYVFVAPVLSADTPPPRSPAYSDSPRDWPQPAPPREDDMDFRQQGYRQQHRGGLILTLGILSLVVCGFLGIPAWIMGNADLAAMQRGEMDRSGEGLTRAGQVLGIVATILMGLGVCIWFMIFVVAAAAH